MTPAQIAALRAVSERCRAAGSKVWLEPAAVDALLDALELVETELRALRTELEAS